MTVIRGLWIQTAPLPIAGNVLIWFRACLLILALGIAHPICCIADEPLAGRINAKANPREVRLDPSAFLIRESIPIANLDEGEHYRRGLLTNLVAAPLEADFMNRKGLIPSGNSISRQIRSYPTARLWLLCRCLVVRFNRINDQHTRIVLVQFLAPELYNQRRSTTHPR